MSQFLDVDPEIVKKKFLLEKEPENADDLEKLFRSPGKYAPQEPWKLVQPTAGFCVKTFDSENKKVFINVCKIDEIPEPKDITEAELLTLWQSDDVSDFRIPLSIQEPHDEFDKSGNPTVAYDVALNSRFFKKVQSNSTFRAFVMQVILEGLENKFDINLKKESFVILQQRKCLGNLNQHRIRTAKSANTERKLLIEELPSSSSLPVSASGDVKPKRKTFANDVFDFRLYKNSVTRVLVGEFYLPRVCISQDVALDIGEDRVIIKCPKENFTLDFFLPFKIDETRTCAQFTDGNPILKIEMPVATPAA